MPKDTHQKCEKISDFLNLYTNAESLLINRHEFKMLLKACAGKPSIIIISEAKTKSQVNINLSEFSLHGYNIFA